MRVLVACEYSGIVRDAFAERGHDAWSCDLLPTERPGNHIQGDVLKTLSDGWDLMIAHPPCTYISTIGMANKKRDINRENKTLVAMEFVKTLWASPINKICIENPKGVLSTRWKRPTQIIQPYYFGQPDRKMTCLWLKGLSKLNGIVEVAINKKSFEPVPYKVYPNGRKQYWSQMIDDTVKRSERGKHKSMTFKCIANAMAEQWGYQL